MTAREWTATAAWLSAAYGKPMASETAEVYFELLRDLPAEAVLAAAKRAALESRYPVIPPVGTLRQLALEMASPELLSAAEAWLLIHAAIKRFGFDGKAAGLASLPPIVRRAAECVGWLTLCDRGENEWTRKDFVKHYEQLSEKEQKNRLLPPVLKAMVEGIGAAPELLPREPDTRNSTQVLVDAIEAGILPRRQTLNRKRLPAPARNGTR
jgi:hypothetical protein